MFAHRGAEAPVSLIAERAGVGMGTLYRRFPAKEDLLRQVCATSMERTCAEAEHALAEPDAWQAFAGFMRRCTDNGTTGLTHLAGSFTVTEAMIELAERVRCAVQAVLDRAHAHGPLRPGVTAADAMQFLQQLRVTHGRDAPTADRLRARYLTALLDGLRGAEPLPGCGAAWEDTARPWGSPAGGADDAGRSRTT